MADTRLDEILIVDIESTCWDEGEQPPNEVSDIIEIGVAHLNVSTLEMTANWNMLVRPTRSSVSPFCTELNGHTQERLDQQGMSLKDALDRLRLVRSKDRVWASYGDYDRRKFEKDCFDLKLPYPFGPRHTNVKSLFALSYGLGAEVGMARALELLGMPLEGRHHAGIDDVKNISKILAMLLRGARAATCEAKIVHMTEGECDFNVCGGCGQVKGNMRSPTGHR